MQKQKQSLLIEHLKKTPIVSIACQKTGIGRATYYRWCKGSTKFKKAAEEAINEGVSLVNDMAESQLLSAIRDQNITAIFYWLNHRHPAYKNRLELNGEIKSKNATLTPEQQKAIERALRLASLDGENLSNNTF